MAGDKTFALQGRGWIVSLITHLILVALLFLPMFAFQDPPPPEEEGVLVSLGLPDQGQGDEAPTKSEEKPEPQPEPVKEQVKVTPAVKTPQKQVTSKVITSNEQDEVRVREATERKQAEAESQRKAAEDLVVT